MGSLMQIIDTLIQHNYPLHLIYCHDFTPAHKFDKLHLMSAISHGFNDSKRKIALNCAQVILIFAQQNGRSKVHVRLVNVLEHGCIPEICSVEDCILTSCITKISYDKYTLSDF